MSGTIDGNADTVEYFGKYTHTIRFRTLEDVDRCLPAILGLLGESVEDLPAARDGEHECFTVDLVTNEPLDAAQIASIQGIEGVLSCSCNEDMQESGLLAH